MVFFKLVDSELYQNNFSRGGFAKIFDKYREIISTRPDRIIPILMLNLQSPICHY